MAADPGLTLLTTPQPPLLAAYGAALLALNIAIQKSPLRTSWTPALILPQSGPFPQHPNSSVRYFTFNLVLFSLLDIEPWTSGILRMLRKK